MEVGSASIIGTAMINEPAQTFVTMSEMTRPESPANEPWEYSISSGKRTRPMSWKAKQAATKNVQQPERNGKSKPRRPQREKSKSLAFHQEAQMCQWPAKSQQDGSFQRQFVQCDNCELWYHFGCAGFVEGDPRLEEPDCLHLSAMLVFVPSGCLV
ncbi:hypothetical protein EDB19DRAFT_370959 [Suillus lakei]|nr:hypothetical protein EDB19DRAFT_370959 [Suillus lakei]